jgi:hypothetical protein
VIESPRLCPSRIVVDVNITINNPTTLKVAESLSAQVKYSSCAQAYTTLKEKSGSAPESGSYALQGASAVWKAYCVMDDTELGLKAGWLRVGVDGMNLNVIKENEKARCAFSTEIYTRGCLGFSRLCSV